MDFSQNFGAAALECLFAPYNDVALLLLIVLGCVYALSGLDDLFVDLVAWLGGCRPRRLTAGDTDQMFGKEEKVIAVIIPAWEEWEVIAQMLTGNAARIDYQNYHFFVGVYPNDRKTQEEVRAARQEFANIHAVVNDRPGPTSKGQVLNHTISRILDHEREHEVEFDAILMHDAEDVIHPLSLKLVNHYLDLHDFIQLPVFSLQRSFGQLVAGTYIDEFAESHTKDLLVRDKLGAAVPSAGVGTALSRRLLQELRSQDQGQVFRESSLTEDYELGIRAHGLNAKSHFACVWYEDPRTGKREFIATREYFPKAFRSSVRQKTRWIAGIVFQGARQLSWCGSWANRYFLARDRKAVFTNLATLLGYLALAYVAFYAWLVNPLPLEDMCRQNAVSLLFLLNIAFMGNRVLQRHVSVVRVYGTRGALPVLLRWPLAILINACASLRAILQHAGAWIRGKKIVWAKTSHEIPHTFEPAPSLADLVLAPAEADTTAVGGRR